MAKRPVFVPGNARDQLVRVISMSFEWSPGLASVQKKKNIAALHQAARAHNLFPLLEVSTKSEKPLGRKLSSFSLNIDTEVGPISVESAFQGSKVFEMGGPYTDLYKIGSREAKRDSRLRNSGRLVKFRYFDQDWPLCPRTGFYDWLYLTALKPHQTFLERLYKYKGFTDIEFNPEKSINCQARSCALLVSLLKLGCLEDVLTTQETLINTILAQSFQQHGSEDSMQRELLR